MHRYQAVRLDRNKRSDVRHWFGISPNDRIGLNPNRSLGRKCHLFCYFLLPFVFYKATDACFQLKIARYYSLKRQASDSVNLIQPYKRVAGKLMLVERGIYETGHYGWNNK